MNEMYGDPLEIVLRREDERIGCRACEHRVRRKDGRGHRCDMNSPEWPEGRKGSCRHWKEASAG